MYEFVAVERRDRTLFITLDRPEVLNALHAPACRELDQVWDMFAADDDLWIAVVTGRGTAFCSGHDLADGVEEPLPRSGWAGIARRHDLHKPIIAAVNGLALGGGWELALACDIIVADESAVFGLTEPRVGYAALGGGITALVQRLPWPAAMGLLLTGNRIDAPTAHKLGIVTEVAPAGHSLDVVQRYVSDILACAPGALRITKEMAAAVLQTGEEWRALEALSDRLAERLLALEDTHEGARAFVEKRRPRWQNT